jgi:predicted nucleic acid-binding protein
MEDAFWDSSALVPICVKERASVSALVLGAKYGMVVWWSAPVEMRSAFARLVRIGQLTPSGQAQAQITLEELRATWWEIEPDEPLRKQAERLVDRFPLKAADSLQLAAALAWCLGKAVGQTFISGDAQLIYAAGQVGFQTISV